jgi:hypothetical protein
MGSSVKRNLQVWLDVGHRLAWWVDEVGAFELSRVSTNRIL